MTMRSMVEGQALLKNIAPRGTKRSVRSARRLRREMSLPEVLLWQALRGSQHGLKFRRQHPTGLYDLDFFCSDARLAVEVDGEAHERGNPPARDAARDGWLAEAGIATMRIPAVDVLRNLEGVVQGILAEAVERLPVGHPAGSSPSLLGEGDQPKAGGGACASPAKTSEPLHPDAPRRGPPPRDELGEDL
jgi:very-short-patch-repair endonuclease